MVVVQELLVFHIFIAPATLSFSLSEVVQIHTHVQRLYMFVFVVVREAQFQNGVAHKIQFCKNQVSHLGPVSHGSHFSHVAHLGH